MSEFKDLVHDAVLWPATSPDSFGNPRVLAKTPIKCRFELGTQVTRNPISSTQQIDGWAAVDRAIPINSILWRGELEDVGLEPTGLLQVVDYSEIDDVKGQLSRRVVLLTKWNGRLPTAA